MSCCLFRSGLFAPLLAFALALGLSACGSSSKIEVERTLAEANFDAKATFVMLPAAQQDRARDFKKYSDQIATQLRAHGLRQVEDAAQARYALMFSYDGDGIERYSDERHKALDPKKHKEGQSDRTLTIILYDLTKPRLVDETVFGGYAQCSVDSLKRDPLVIPAMIDAVLKDFPGSNGRDTYTENLPEFK
jgi:hypothetical protein